MVTITSETGKLTVTRGTEVDEFIEVQGRYHFSKDGRMLTIALFSLRTNQSYDVLLRDLEINGSIPADSAEATTLLDDALEEAKDFGGGGGGGGGVTSVTAADASIVVDNSDPTTPTVGLPYKVYTALFAQSGTSAPTASVLQNTLTGAPTYSRLNSGRYLLTKAGEFTLNKTFIPYMLTPGNNISLIPLSDANEVIGYFGIVPNGDGDSMFIQVFNSSFVYTDWSTLMGSDSIALEIRVYP